MLTHKSAKIQNYVVTNPVSRTGSEASTRQSDQIAVFDVVEKTKCLVEIGQVSGGCLSSIGSRQIIQSNAVIFGKGGRYSGPQL